MGGAEAKQKFKDVPGVTKAFSGKQLCLITFFIVTLSLPVYIYILGNVPPANWSEANHIGIHKCTKFEEQFVYHRCTSS